MYIYEINTRIALLRERLGLKQKEFAPLLGVSINTISRYETGENSPDYDFLVKLIDKSGCNPEWLFMGCGDMFKIPYLEYYPPPDYEGVSYIRENPAEYATKNAENEIKSLKETVRQLSKLLAEQQNHES